MISRNLGSLWWVGQTAPTDRNRLRGVVFTINFLAVLGMWGRILFTP